MPSLDPRAYAMSPKGKATRARARARYLAKRRAERVESLTSNPAPLIAAINQWGKL